MWWRPDGKQGKLSFALRDGLPQLHTPSDRIDGRWGVTACHAGMMLPN